MFDNYNLWYILGGIASAIISYFVGKEKTKAEVRKEAASAQREEVDTVKEAILIWKEMSFEFKKEVEHLSSEVAKLKKENEALLEEVDKMRKENEYLKKEVESLRQLVNQR